MTPTDLDQQLRELQSAAYTYAGRHQFIPDLTWPEGARIAVNFTCDFDAMLLRRLLNEPPMQLAKGEFGGRVGIWRLVEFFDAHQVKATIFTPGRICELYPQALRAVVESGHEIADHMWEHRVPKEAALGVAAGMQQAEERTDDPCSPRVASDRPDPAVADVRRAGDWPLEAPPLFRGAFRTRGPWH
jgi:peptidoglycan/xylan/chitin deacetylase (PgdA/CDA1 family)